MSVQAQGAFKRECETQRIFCAQTPQIRFVRKFGSRCLVIDFPFGEPNLDNADAVFDLGCYPQGVRFRFSWDDQEL